LMTALQEKIQPILCIGETLEEREAGRTEEVLQKQLDKALESISDKDVLSIVIAYEPVWAIGTGKSATTDQIQQVHQFCRSCLEKRFGEKIAHSISVLYGGSVNSDNIKEIVALQDVNGVLVGGASLDPEGFAKIINQLTGI
jgi:triosephosphate isomerase